MWGCFLIYNGIKEFLDVFPTHVGMFLVVRTGAAGGESLPHACGDVSHIGRVIGIYDLSSPRMWGCFQRTELKAPVGQVFPTHVGVFLITQLCNFFDTCLPHTRGGVSELAKLLGYKDESSPHMWGCFCRSF